MPQTYQALFFSLNKRRDPEIHGSFRLLLHRWATVFDKKSRKEERRAFLHSTWLRSNGRVAISNAENSLSSWYTRPSLWCSPTRALSVSLEREKQVAREKRGLEKLLSNDCCHHLMCFPSTECLSKEKTIACGFVFIVNANEPLRRI